MLYPVILAGGIGTRLWPLSRAALPKQFIHFPEQNASLFQNTLKRLQDLPELQSPIVVCNNEQRFLVAEQLRQLGYEDAVILLEPVGRNTAPAVALAALWIKERDPEGQMLVLPADHSIADVAAFHAAVHAGLEQSARNRLVTFGIVPGSPETGYGYIRMGAPVDPDTDSVARVVEQFVEKPDEETAERYLADGNYLWNSGMFLFRADVFLSQLAEFADDISASCQKAYAALKTGPDFQAVPEEEFAACRSDSIDYAVMEKTDSAAVIPLDAGWSDLGAWDSLWDSETRDEQGNVLSGDVVTHGVSNSYIQSRSRLVAAVGLDDVVIVESPDAVLVADKARSQEVKQIVAQLQARQRPEVDTHTLVHRPWGSFQSLASGPGYQVKHIVVNPGAALSLQMHQHRAEHWTVIKGTALVTCGEQEQELQVNESVFIPLGAKHRLVNQQTDTLEVIEVQVGDYLGEDDIVRFEDLYGRTN